MVHIHCEYFINNDLLAGHLWIFRYQDPVIICSIHSFIYSFKCLFIHSFIHSFIHLFIHSFIHSFIYSFIHLFIHSFIHLFIHSFIHSFIYSFIHLFIHSFIHPFIPFLEGPELRLFAVWLLLLHRTGVCTASRTAPFQSLFTFKPVYLLICLTCLTVIGELIHHDIHYFELDRNLFV